MATVPSGPGPGAYVLPPTIGYDKHDNRKPRMPQYSFGARTSTKGLHSGPGPGAYMVDKLTRYGRAAAYQYTIAGRARAAKGSEPGPGPGAHDVHLKPFFNGINAPAYSMARRNEINYKRGGPGPNAYKFEINTIRPAPPAFSMGLQSKPISRTVSSPGPAAYAAADLNLKLSRPPTYSIGSRWKPLKSDNVGPGPNYYDLMYYRPGKSGGAYSFGIRHSQFAPPMIVKCDNM